MSASTPVATPVAQRLEMRVRGAVQGVGFRPFVFRLANELGLAGFVENSPQGVSIEVEGGPLQVRAFAQRLEAEAPTNARIQSLVLHELPARDGSGFEIRSSARTGECSAVVLPDLAICSDCRNELYDLRDRRYRYPFTNCTQCGPRYSIVLDLPYDRARTTMARFAMCPPCRAEYEDPRNRRFHAEPNACPSCGPQLEFWGPHGSVLAEGADALQGAVAALRAGRIVALKGLGGFQLLVDARDDAAVRLLRARKQREAKPLAVMVPSRGAALELCQLEPAELALLASPQAPIVIARRQRASAGTLLAASVAPDNPNLGLMLPYTPLHLLLLGEFGGPVVATSGNRSDEPLCTDEHEALDRLRGIADEFLVHDRPIVRAVDDSVVRLVAGRPLILRRARGYAPLPVGALSGPPTLAVGGHQKNTIAVSSGGQAVLSPHVGDLDNLTAVRAFRATVTAITRLYEVAPRRVACDRHPDYVSTQLAEKSGQPLVTVQHHHAHALACLADNHLVPPALALTWDGSGYGLDGTIWGGEALLIGDRGFTRAAWLRTFSLPGGERAVRQPRRSAIGLLYETLGADLFEHPDEPAWKLFSPAEREGLKSLLRQGLNCPRTSSMGRLFDGVAALLGLHPMVAFEGQAAMALEYEAQDTLPGAPYPFALHEAAGREGLTIDWEPLLLALLREHAEGRPRAAIAGRFHDTLAAIAAAVATRLGEPRVLLTGGCFQNRVLTERTIAALRRVGAEPYWHRDVPPNDGGLALGQLVAAQQTEER